MRLLQLCFSSSPGDATGEEHLYAQEPVLTVGQLLQWTGEAWDLLATFESWGPPWLLLGRVFLLLVNHWKVLAKHVDSWISFSKQSESRSLRTEFRGLGCLGDFNCTPVRTLKMYS